MSNFDDIRKENIKERNQNWPQIPDHSKRMLIIGGSGSGKKVKIYMIQNINFQLTRVKLQA